VDECRVLALIGSGETSPTMVTVHRDLVSRLGSRRPRAIVLATPYAFQVNAADVSASARKYFAASVDLDVTIVAATSPAADPGMAAPMVTATDDETREAAAIRAADWVFAGPGSPSYALAHWQARPIAAALRDRIFAPRGITVLASAAAATAGQLTFPVYEIYKAGAAPRWLPALNLLGPVGLNLAVIPHYDNHEARYDTRYCYLGAHRLTTLESQLPERTTIIGIDEHTALLLDLASNEAEVVGRGQVTLRRSGTEYPLPAGTTLTMNELRALVHGTPTTSAGARAGECVGRRSVPPDDAGTGPSTPLPVLMKRAAEQNPADLAERILDLEDAIKAWETDTEEDQGTEQARLLLRALITRLGRAAQAAHADPVERLRPVIEPLITLRSTLRDQGQYAVADALRDVLVNAGVDVRDTPGGTRCLAADGDARS